MCKNDAHHFVNLGRGMWECLRCETTRAFTNPRLIGEGLQEKVNRILHIVSPAPEVHPNM